MADKNIKIVYSSLHKKHLPKKEIHEGKKVPHPEVPERIETIIKTLAQRGYTNVISPKLFPEAFLEKIHHPNYISFIKRKSASLQDTKRAIYASWYIVSLDSPIFADTYAVAKGAVDVALTGADLLQNGETLVYSLCRPPGHHAEYFKMGGYCYFNNAAAAAEYLSQTGKVAILDIDFHHGNGTQSIFYDRCDVFSLSIHGDPNQKYPYSSGFENEIGVDKGKGYNRNFPLPIGTDEKTYEDALTRAVRLIKEFQPMYLVISLGFDTYNNDPVTILGEHPGSFQLSIPFYPKIAEQVDALHLPTLLVQEGGYAMQDLGELAASFLDGFSSS